MRGRIATTNANPCRSLVFHGIRQINVAAYRITDVDGGNNVKHAWRVGESCARKTSVTNATKSRFALMILGVSVFAFDHNAERTIAMSVTNPKSSNVAECTGSGGRKSACCPSPQESFRRRGPPSNRRFAKTGASSATEVARHFKTDPKPQRFRVVFLCARPRSLMFISSSPPAQGLVSLAGRSRMQM